MRERRWERGESRGDNWRNRRQERGDSKERPNFEIIALMREFHLIPRFSSKSEDFPEIRIFIKNLPTGFCYWCGCFLILPKQNRRFPRNPNFLGVLVITTAPISSQVCNSNHGWLNFAVEIRVIRMRNVARVAYGIWCEKYGVNFVDLGTNFGLNFGVNFEEFHSEFRSEFWSGFRSEFWSGFRSEFWF